MKNKKSQIKMFETIAVLLIFFVLIGLGLIFYGRIQAGSFQETQEENFELKAIQTAQLVSFLPELQCSSNNIIVDDCFDILKVEALSEFIEQNPNIRNEYYYDLFGFSSINIEQIYPSVVSWSIYERTTEITKAKSSIMIPVSLYNASSRAYNFGILTVAVYRK